jgi:hypothetical protein
MSQRCPDRLVVGAVVTKLRIAVRTSRNSLVNRARQAWSALVEAPFFSATAARNDVDYKEPGNAVE